MARQRQSLCLGAADTIRAGPCFWTEEKADVCLDGWVFILITTWKRLALHFFLGRKQYSEKYSEQPFGVNETCGHGYQQKPKIREQRKPGGRKREGSRRRRQGRKEETAE